MRLGFLEFIKEDTIEASTKAGTMSLWHGGNLENESEATKKQAKGRFEYAPGLYLTTHYDTAKGYSKGSRKLYLITIEKGNSLEDSLIDIEDVIKFVKSTIVKKDQSLILDRLEKYLSSGKIKGYIFVNILLNNKLIKESNSDKLRDFLISQDIDYSVVPNAFGWGETMIVLFNMKKIKEKIIVKPNDKIIEFDLPTGFN